MTSSNETDTIAGFSVIDTYGVHECCERGCSDRRTFGMASTTENTSFLAVCLKHGRAVIEAVMPGEATPNDFLFSPLPLSEYAGETGHMLDMFENEDGSIAVIFGTVNEDGTPGSEEFAMDLDGALSFIDHFVLGAGRAGLVAV
jgi:hypothetical protein